MDRIHKLGWPLLLVAVALICSCRRESLTEQQAVEASWQAFQPNTSSGDRANWHVMEVRQVQGSEVAKEYEGGPRSHGCWQGPTPPANGTVSPATRYWYVRWAPRPATELPRTRISPTQPPAVPEPFVVEGRYLLDLTSGAVVARKLSCIIY
jgi:hypothetical protein